MGTYSTLTTKVSKTAMLKEKLAKDDRWICRGLLTVYDHQTEDEQRAESTQEHNGVGFGGVDGEILTSYAKRLIAKGAREAAYDLTKKFSLSAYLTPAMEATLRNKMPKYAGQLLRISSKVSA